MGAPTEWINNEFLKLALSNNNEDESIRITGYDIKPAVESGDNYCTQLFRVRVKYRGETDETKSLIVKAPLEDGAIAKSLVDEAKLLKNEFIMYSEILPRINAISKRQFCPKTYFCAREDVLVMDDLMEEGFKMGDRLQQLDFNHCKEFLKTLGEYHAATVALHKQNSELIESNSTHPLYNKNKKSDLLNFFGKIKQNAFIEIVKKHGVLESFVETIEGLGDKLRTLLIETLERRGPLNVLNHGDSWTNNIMFKYTDNGEIIECKLIDYQIRSYGSPAYDLLYFLFCSARPEVRQRNMEELLELYNDTLNQTLEKLDCKERLSFQELKEELKNSCPWALFAVINFLPMILNEPDELTAKLKENPENLKSPDINLNPALRLFLGKTYNDILPGLCEDLVKLGVIEYFKNIQS